MNRTAAIVTSVLVSLVVIAGLVISGSPGTQRQIRLDRQRVADLQLLSTLVEQYWQRNSVLPATLPELIDGTRVASLPTDPVSGTSYEYRIDGQRNFTLCATFTRAAEDDSRQTFWNHAAGRTCFDFQAEPVAAIPR